MGLSMDEKQSGFRTVVHRAREYAEGSELPGIMQLSPASGLRSLQFRRKWRMNFYKKYGAIEMTRVSDLMSGWLGWCPDARILTTTQPGLFASPPGNPTMLPDGGSPGPGRIRRGKDVTRESITMLVRNRGLLWFSFLMFLTFIVSIVTDRYIRFISGTNAFPGVLNSPAILALTGTAAFMEHFVFFSLAAGLILCVAQIPLGNAISFRDGLSRAWCHKRPLAGWTIIGALLWISVSYYTIGFYLITVFALPAIVLDNKDLVAALRDSVLRFRRRWVEMYVSFGIILLISMGFILVTLFSLGQVAFAPGLIPEGIPAGMITLVVSGLMAIGLMVMGIATGILYTEEKTGVPLQQ